MSSPIPPSSAVPESVAVAATAPTTAAPSLAASPAPSAAAPAGRGTEFRAVEGGPEMQSGQALLVEAYAAMWLFVFFLVFMSLRKLRTIDARIDRLTDELARTRADGEAKG